MAFKREYLLVDGYNVIFAWDKLKKIAEYSLEEARLKLMGILSDFGGATDIEIILVFDAHKVKKNKGYTEKHYNITVVYTKEAQTADHYIENSVKELMRQKKYKVRVATSDHLEQIIIISHGAGRISAGDLFYEIEATKKVIKEQYIENRPVKNNMLLDNLDKKTAELLESMRKSKGR